MCSIFPHWLSPFINEFSYSTKQRTTLFRISEIVIEIFKDVFFFGISSCPFSEHTEWNYTISQNHQHPASAFQNQKECRALKSRLLWGGDQAIYQNPRKVFGPRKGFFPSIFNDPRVFLCKVESRPGYLSILQRWKITNLENAVCVAWHYKWWVSFFHTRWVSVFKIL